MEENCKINYWRTKSDFKKKINVNLSINENKILFAKFFNETNKNNDLIEYFEELLKMLEENEIKNSLFIMDNAKFHISRNCSKFYVIKI